MVDLNTNAISKETNKGKALSDLQDRIVTLELLEGSVSVDTAVSEVSLDNTTPPTATAGKGFIPGTGNEGLVAQLAVAAMAVRIQTAGVAWNSDGKRVAIPTSTSIAVAASDPTNGRKDIVVVTKTGALAVRTGTPAGSPADPTLVDGDVPLARLTVAATVTTILTANIADLRSRNSLEGTKLLGGSVAGKKLDPTGVTSGSFTGHNNVGACTLTGATVGQRVFALFEIDTSSTTVGEQSKFESVITVADQIQQTDAGNLSAKKYAVILLPIAA